MENQKRARNERGQFKRSETLFTAEKPSEGIVEASTPYVMTLVHGDDRIETVRGELAELIAQEAVKPYPTQNLLKELPEVPQMTGGETSVVAEKELKRRIKEVKESAPRLYDEKLLVVSDLQLLRETNEEGVGAFLKYVKDQGKSFTHIVLNGDIMDFSQQSGFRKDNQMGDAVTRDEQVAGRWFIDFMAQECPNAKKVFMMGNHEARYANMYLDTNNGVAQYLRPFEEVFGLQDWEVHQYGKGESYDWHGRKIRHGTRTGKQDIGKLEMADNWRSNTLGHAVVNKMGEFVDADGNSFTTFLHAGFSKVADYDKTGNKTPSNGFGVYYGKQMGRKWVENGYQIIIPANNPMFISPEGNFYSGEGFSLRKEIGLETRGRPRK